jgi:ABC-type nitrate/sulfonate/bicarbonate transport system substrate-binding protein
LAALNDMNGEIMDEIKIGIGTSSIGRFLPLVGHTAGLFEKTNIAVEIVKQQDEEKVVEDIVAQTTPVGTPNAPSLIFSLLNGNDLVIVGGILNRPAFFLAANETIAGLSDIKGKRIGINQPRRMAGMVMLALLRRWGVNTERDLTLVDFGLNDRSFEALRTGEIDAALLPPEKAFLVETEGFTWLPTVSLWTVIGSPWRRLGDFSPPTGIWSRKSFSSTRSVSVSSRASRRKLSGKLVVGFPLWPASR